MIIIFDLWETVAKKPYSIINKIKEKFKTNISKKDLRLLYESNMQRKKNSDKLIKNIINEIKIENNNQNFEIIKKWIIERGKKAKFIKGMKKLILKLKKNNTLVLFSNTTELTYNEANKSLNLENLFDYNFSSYHHGYIKPEKKAYTKLLKKLNVVANEVIFIDDNKNNIDTAKKLGIKTILFKDSKRTEEKLALLMK